MGTRSTVKFIRKRGEKLTPLVNIYQQWDGYIEGVGHDLAQFLIERKLINGIPYEKNCFGYANGFECLIAQYIAAFKNEVGGFYITDFDDSQEYNYEVVFDADKYFDHDFYKDEDMTADELITIKVDTIFEGTPSELLEFKESDDEEESKI